MAAFTLSRHLFPTFSAPVKIKVGWGPLSYRSVEVKILFAIQLRDQSVISRKAGVKLLPLEVPFTLDHEGRGL